VAPPFFNLERCISNNPDKKQRYPPHTVLSDLKCRDCDTRIKKRLVMLASDNGHKPPELCYAHRCVKRKKMSSRDRKVVLAKERKRKRDALKKPG
jgi:hypothetical protein